ncbi:hypothetical protein POJ06DRAFT_244853 [Lipomyces tetrasporus]|uniref:Uncharacterized protein n=1 Tax=Lipomyces tetrasporus TaxID=54092 RepID=A0AAD7VV17_9ASCO|nr:uncharacterized protein POJ06DRAFT_244853 [Lipomyces tetrasporus]KAJ8102506.1 hypothetical protein POJ06DRAFT_244853 [Lipomyces tetrasporus]
MESAADVMNRLRLLKEKKAAASASSKSVNGVKRKASESANEVMEKLRRMKELKNGKAAVSVKKDEDGFRIVDPEEDDDDGDYYDDDADDDDDDDAEEQLDDDDDWDRGDDPGYEDQDEGEEDEFTGFDDDLAKAEEKKPARDYDDDGPVVIRFDGSKTERMIKAPTPRDRRNFMSQSAPRPETVLEKQAAKYKSKQKPEEVDDERMNLKHDVELQRLITESHILSEASRKGGAISLSDVSFDPIGKARIKTMEARIDSLALRSGGKVKSSKKDYYSIDPQTLLGSQREKFNKEKMPMRMRKGMLQKKIERKEKYEKNAREAGIVLPKAPRRQKKSKDMRDRGLKIQSVGRFTPSGLKLSKSEIARQGRH